MDIHVELTDADGEKSTRIEQRRWLLNFVSDVLENGDEVLIVTDGGQISARRLDRSLIMQSPHVLQQGAA